MRRGGRALCVGLALPFGLLAQAPSGNPAAPALKVTTHLVVLNVVVTDKKGHPMGNLSKDDFTVLENEQQQTIDTFEAPAIVPSGNETAAEGPIATDAKPAMVRAGQARTIIVLDELNTISEDLMFATVKVKKYLEAQPAILKQPTSIYLLTKRKLELFAAPTQDRNALLAMLKKNFIELPPHYLESGGVQGGADRLLASLIALDEIALANAVQKTRKNVIWIGNGVPILSNTYVSGRDSEKFRNWVHYTANWLEETQTTVYTLDPRGVEVAQEAVTTGGLLVAGGLPAAGIVGPNLTSSELVFEAIAPESGGAILRRRNDLEIAIANAVDDGSSYYTLSYYPSDRNWDGKFRKIRVAVAGSDLQARTQHGYYAYAEGFQGTDEQIDWSLSRAVTSPVAFQSIAFTASGVRVAAPVRTKSRNATQSAKVVLSVDRGSLSWTGQPNGDQRSEVTVVTSELNSAGRVLGYHVREVEVVVEKPKWEGLAAKDPVQLYVNADLPMKTDHLRVVIRDASTGQLGTFDLPAGALVAANTSPTR
jgi:VWFA-related protein